MNKIPAPADRLHAALHDLACFASDLRRECVDAEQRIDGSRAPSDLVWNEFHEHCDNFEKDATTADELWLECLSRMKATLDRFWQAWESSQAVLNEMPDDLLEKLDVISGVAHWAERCRATIDALGKWHYWSGNNGNENGTDLQMVVSTIREQGLPEWDDPLRELDKFKDHLLAMRNCKSLVETEATSVSIIRSQRREQKQIGEQIAQQREKAKVAFEQLQKLANESRRFPIGTLVKIEEDTRRMIPEILDDEQRKKYCSEWAKLIVQLVHSSHREYEYELDWPGRDDCPDAEEFVRIVYIHAADGEQSKVAAELEEIFSEDSPDASHFVCYIDDLARRLSDQMTVPDSKDSALQWIAEPTYPITKFKPPDFGIVRSDLNSKLENSDAQTGFSLLDRFTDSTEGHVEFLEFVRDEVRYAAEAKRHQFQERYTDETLSKMIDGIRWSESLRRAEEISDLPSEEIDAVKRVLKRKLTVGTVEQIDELLTPVVKSLRDAFEDRAGLEGNVADKSSEDAVSIIQRLKDAEHYYPGWLCSGSGYEEEDELKPEHVFHDAVVAAFKFLNIYGKDKTKWKDELRKKWRKIRHQNRNGDICGNTDLEDAHEELVDEFVKELVARLQVAQGDKQDAKLDEAEGETAVAKRAGKKSPKRSTEKGEAETKLIAALTQHHKYSDGSCLNLNPIGNNQLAEMADVSNSTASKFFKDRFDGHTKYRSACRDMSKLVAALKLLNQEFSPHHLFGKSPPTETERDDENE